MKTTQHLTDLIGILHNQVLHIRLKKAKIATQYELCFQFGNRTHSNSNKALKLGRARSCMPFGNVRWNRHSGTTHLIDQAKSLLAWKAGSSFVHQPGRHQRQLPDFQ